MLELREKTFEESGEYFASCKCAASSSQTHAKTLCDIKPPVTGFAAWQGKPANLHGATSRDDPEKVKLSGVDRALAKDEGIFLEGDNANFFHQVVRGAIRTSRLLCDGRRQIDAFHLPGDIFGLELGREHRCSAEATGVATVVAYRSLNFSAFACNDSLAHQVMASAMRSLARAQDHILLLGRKSALEKIAAFILDLAERCHADRLIELPMSRADIADHLGLTIETVSRSFAQLAQKRIIGLPTHRSILLRDIGALRELNF